MNKKDHTALVPPPSGGTLFCKRLERYLRVLGLVLALGLFSACTAAPSPTLPGEAVLPSPSVPASPSPTRRLTTAAAAHAAPMPTATPLPALPTAPAFALCSPLAWETLPELAEIVGDPYRPPPPERAEERHHGVDFSHYARKGHPSILGEPVQSVLPGMVVASITDRLPYGNMVIVETPQEALPAALVAVLGLQPGESLYLLYAHFQEAPLVRLGEAVACGQALGTVGKTGYNIVNEHLHLETRRGPAGARFESMAFYTAAATPEEMATYQRWRTGGEFAHFDPFLLLNLSLPGE